ncbi:GPW/gp25 family protein [Methylomagnum sp.]
MRDRKNSFLGRGWGFPPTFDAASSGVRMVEADADIRQSLGILFSTLPGERIMLPRYGCPLHALVFEGVNDTLVTQLETLLADAILYFEPRIRVDAINVSQHAHADGLLLIELDYTVIQTNTRSNMVYPFYLLEGTNVRRLD